MGEMAAQATAKSSPIPFSSSNRPMLRPFNAGLIAVFALVVNPAAAESPVTRPGPAFEQFAAPVGIPDSSRARVFRWMYQDVGALAQHVGTPRFALYAGGTMAATFGLAWLDDDVRDAVQSIYHGTFEDVLDVADYFGGPKINVPVVALAGGSLLTNNVKFRDAAFTSLQTLIYAGLIGYGLKGIFGRERPEWSDDTYAFFSRTGKNPFTHEGNSSYPGGHAIASFGIVTPWVVYYPSLFTYALYAIPIGTGLSRIALDKHWATDILVGAFIGISMGRWLSHRHRAIQRADRLNITVLDDGNLFRIAVRLE